uniref:Groucho/TLE N-terminal Q-rich domain-containing protein n=1 Tax=Coturnix japonica TaxID=93934 RepID=A0A8C2TE00_COTJA
MQRRYVMYYEMSYGLNIEMHKQAEIVKRLSAICAHIVPFLTQEHQQQVLRAVERAKQVSMAELSSIVGVSRAVQQWGWRGGLHCLVSPALGSCRGGCGGHRAPPSDCSFHLASHPITPCIAVSSLH